MPKSDTITIAEAYQKMCGEAISLFQKQEKRIVELEKEVKYLSDEGSWLARFRSLELEQEKYIVEYKALYEQQIEEKKELEYRLHILKCAINAIDPKCHGYNSITKEDVDDYTQNPELKKLLYEEFNVDEEEEEEED
jgi:hypothetical protein